MSLLDLIPAILFSRKTRIIYLIICGILMIIGVRFMLHYRQILEDAMNQK
jgi:hypothetical protein